MKVSELDIVQRALVDAKKGGLAMEDVMAMLPPGHTDQHIMVMLYDHRFNKALWGTDEYTNELNDGNIHGGVAFYATDLADVYLDGDCWQYHLMCMALSGDPVAYIAEYKYGVKVDDTEN